MLVRGTFCFPDRLPDNLLHESARLGTGGRGAEKEFCGDLVVRASADDEREHLAARFAELRPVDPGTTAAPSCAMKRTVYAVRPGKIRGLSECVDDSFRWGS
ncbi:hypothetical protein ACF1HJ_06105 [Streptomyces sp. NPDC013978]|uniref:hypothetical protein n=1 Tax=Streptomyces sp. NPDC013978 TaxID=3364869 RepID=UPI003701DA30